MYSSSAAAPSPKPRPLRGLLLIALLLPALPARPALAHEYWLAPARYDVRPRQPVELGAFAGTGFRGERKPWSSVRCVRFVARAERTLDLTRGAAPGEDVWARFAPADDGGAMLVFESGFIPIELPAAQFDAYLAEEGLHLALAARRRAGTHVAGRERYRRCAKAWLSGRDAARATKPIGLPLEIVPLASPGSGPALRVRVLANGKPLPGARVKSWRSPLGPAGEPRDPAARDSVAIASESATDERGEATVACAAQGEWLVSVVDMRPCRDRAVADWESTWSSLTFARRPAARARR